MKTNNRLMKSASLVAFALAILPGIAFASGDLRYELFTGTYRLSADSGCGGWAGNLVVLTNAPATHQVILKVLPEDSHYVGRSYIEINQGRIKPDSCFQDGFHPEGVSVVTTNGSGNLITVTSESYERGVFCSLKIAMGAYDGRAVETLEVDGNKLVLTEEEFDRNGTEINTDGKPFVCTGERIDQ
jgi:hypothetical protein